MLGTVIPPFYDIWKLGRYLSKTNKTRIKNYSREIEQTKVKDVEPICLLGAGLSLKADPGLPKHDRGDNPQLSLLPLVMYAASGRMS